MDVPKGSRWCEYNDINVHNVIMSKIPWLRMVVDESNLVDKADDIDLTRYPRVLR